ncbi:MAG: hypothetical protein IT203_11135 [Fimbriimonadaceae bacterium]|nr:hypothetical protein [Fimbriimonadaceae bacterium]
MKQNFHFSKQLKSILAIGALICVVALSVRLFYRRPLAGNWLGYAYAKIEGASYIDKDMGQYRIRLREDGTYMENGNSTSGVWKRTGSTVTLSPTRFYDMTPDEHRYQQKLKKGKTGTSVVLENLLAAKMKPIVLHYARGADQLIWNEADYYFVYERID